MGHWRTLSLFVLTVVYPIQALTQVLPNYRCEIQRVLVPGQKDKQVQESVQRTYAGKNFSVERRTGVMDGVLKNAFVTRPEVIDFGSADNSFKAVTTLRLEQGVGRGTNVHVLVVNEYEKSAEKTFVFLDNADVYIGVCTHQR